MLRTSVGHLRQDIGLISIILNVGGSQCQEHFPLAHEAERLPYAVRYAETIGSSGVL